LHTLTQKQLLVAASDGQGYVPARDLERIGLKEILNSLRTAGGREELPNREGNKNVVDDVTEQVDQAVATTLAGKSLKSLVLSQPPPNPTSE
jgi:DNA-binding IscR family transcriptional regulator